MVVQCRYDEARGRWQLQWYCQGKQQLCVRDATLDGDRAASERVARRLHRLLEDGPCLSDVEYLREQLDASIAEEVAAAGAVLCEEDGCDASEAAMGEEQSTPTHMETSDEDDDAFTESDSRLRVPLQQQRLECWWDEVTELPDLVDTGPPTAITRSPTYQYEVFLPHVAPGIPYTTTLSDIAPALGDFFALAKVVGQRRREARAAARAREAFAQAASAPHAAAAAEPPVPLCPNELLMLQTRLDTLSSTSLSQVVAFLERFVDFDAEDDELEVDLDDVTVPHQRDLHTLVERLSAGSGPTSRGAVRWRWRSGVLTRLPAPLAHVTGPKGTP